MNTLTYYSEVKAGKLVTLNRARLQRDLAPFEGTRVELTIKKAKKRRTLPQNRFYFDVVIPCLQMGFRETHGYSWSKEAVHEFCKKEFNSLELHNEKTGEVVSFPQSTTTLSTIEWQEYILKIKAWAMEFFDMLIPDPNEQIKLPF